MPGIRTAKGFMKFIGRPLNYPSEKITNEKGQLYVTINVGQVSSIRIYLLDVAIDVKTSNFYLGTKTPDTSYFWSLLTPICQRRIQRVYYRFISFS